MVRSLKFNHDSDNKLSFLFVIYKLENPFTHVEQNLDFDQTYNDLFSLTKII